MRKPLDTEAPMKHFVHVYQAGMFLGGKCADDMVKRALAPQRSVHQFGEEPPVWTGNCPGGQFAVDEDVGVGPFFFNSQQNLECCLPGVHGGHFCSDRPPDAGRCGG